MNLDKAINNFKTQLLADGRSIHTRQAYLRDIIAFRDWMGSNIEVGKIRPERLAAFFAERAGIFQAVSLNRQKTSLRVFFGYLRQVGVIGCDPSRLVKASPVTRKIPQVLSREECDKVLKTIKESKSSTAKRDHLILSLALGTGMRLGSLSQIRVADINLKEGFIKIRAKGNREEVVFLSPALIKILRFYLKSLKADSPLFASQNGNSLSCRQIQYRIAYWLKAAGISRQASAHTFRHTFATRLYESTGDLHLVQKALGHRQITTTEIYAKASDQSLRQAIKLI